jgi:hypothetical protein
VKRVKLLEAEEAIEPRERTQRLAYPWPFLMSSDGPGPLVRNVTRLPEGPKKGAGQPYLSRRTVKKS